MKRAELIAITLLAFGTAGAAVDDPVRVDTGMISGAATDSPDVRVFKGIPYAAPPVGGQRRDRAAPLAPRYRADTAVVPRRERAI